jgi:hypothetical protein
VAFVLAVLALVLLQILFFLHAQLVFEAADEREARLFDALKFSHDLFGSVDNLRITLRGCSCWQ